MATQIHPTDTSSANSKITAATQITLTDTSSANTNITAVTQICHTDTSSANANITAAPQITHTDTYFANANITAAAQIPHTDTSSADTNITAATQIPLTDTSSANTNTTAATRLNVTQFLDPSRRTRHCGEPYGGHADGCGHLRTVANANAKLGEHSLTPRPPSETGTLATHSGKKKKKQDYARDLEWMVPYQSTIWVVFRIIHGGIADSTRKNCLVNWSHSKRDIRFEITILVNTIKQLHVKIILSYPLTIFIPKHMFFVMGTLHVYTSLVLLDEAIDGSPTCSSQKWVPGLVVVFQGTYPPTTGLERWEMTIFSSPNYWVLIVACCSCIWQLRFIALDRPFHCMSLNKTLPLLVQLILSTIEDKHHVPEAFKYVWKKEHVQSLDSSWVKIPWFLFRTSSPLEKLRPVE